MSNESPAPAQSRLRIMVVEDEPDIGVIITQMLSPHYDVVQASNGLEALDRLSWYQPDLTIMDLMMPVLDGFDTTRAIKKDNDYANMPVMFLTARKDNKSVRDALMAGGDVYLEKPFDPPELLIRLKDMIEKAGLTPRRKQHTLEEIQQHFSGSNPTEEASPAMPPGARPFTEQLARAAAEPKTRVLLVHHSEQYTNAAKEALKRRYEILATPDAELALDKIMAYQPDIIVISLLTPTIHGFHFAQLLRINKTLRVPKIIFLGETDDPDVRTQAQGYGGVLCPGQSLDMDSLSQHLENITHAPGFHRQIKRLNYREILRREDPTDD